VSNLPQAIEIVVGRDFCWDRHSLFQPLYFKDLDVVLANWVSGLPIPVPEMSCPADAANRLRFASCV
jgi:hypothetical protein